MSKTFEDQLDLRSKIVFGENKSPEYDIDQMGDPRVAFFFKLVRNLEKNKIIDFIKKILLLYEKKKDKSLLTDLIVMVFQTRDVRGGKGEKKIFYYYLLELYKIFPKTILNLLKVIPFYGYYKDYFLILEIIYNEYIDKPYDYHIFIKKIYGIINEQLDKDILQYKKKSEKISLLAKYLPREKKHFDKKYNFVKNFTQQFFVQENNLINLYVHNEAILKNSIKRYRKYSSKLNIALDTPEIKMSSKRFSEINFGKVSSKSIFKYRKAFLNEIIKDNESIERHTSEDRRKARKLFLSALEKQRTKSGQLEIHEIVKVVLNNLFSKSEKKLFNTLWNNKKKMLIDSFTEKNKEFKFGKLVPIIDVSGSMSGIPMYVAISLGLMISEINENEKLKNKFITFSEEPKWVKLDDTMDIVDKIYKTVSSDWGKSTNFEAVYKMIGDIILQGKLPESEIPDLIVFTDMQFNEAQGNMKESWKTHHERIIDYFNKIGTKISGKPYNPPKLIYWNLRSDTVGFPTKADTPNTQMLSGYSPSLFKHILSNKPLNKLKLETPYSTLRNILDDERYNLIKDIIILSKEL